MQWYSLPTKHTKLPLRGIDTICPIASCVEVLAARPRLTESCNFRGNLSEPQWIAISCRLTWISNDKKSMIPYGLGI